MNETHLEKVIKETTKKDLKEMLEKIKKGEPISNSDSHHMIVENPFKNRLSFEFDRMGDWSMNGDLWVKEHISSNSKIFSLSSLNINNIYDLMEEATPSIYDMVSWLEDCLKNKEHVYIPFNVEGVRPFYIPDDSINFSVILYFYNEVKKEKHQWDPEGYVDAKRILKFEFKFDDLKKDKNILTKLKHISTKNLKILVNLLLLLILLKLQLIIGLCTLMILLKK